ncbi:MAG: DUF3631 domain-containing protein [Methyloglobulus sp.]
MVDSVNLSGAETPKQSDEEIIKELAALKPLDYDRVRVEKAKAMNVQLKTLDTLVKSGRESEQEAKRLPFDEIEPCQEPIAPAELLDEIAATIKKFIVLDNEQATAAALWVAFTWFIDVLEIAPLAIINAPEKSCGKTQLLTVLGRMAYRPLHAANASPSALFRAVDLWKPTTLIDEADTFFKDNPELHGMVNAGYLRDGFVLRSEAVGDSYEPKAFPVFSAKAIAGVALEKHLPDTTMSRGVVFNLRRKLPHEAVNRLRHADKGLFTAIAAKLARFAADCSQQVRDARPVLPDELSDRSQDNWDGLLAVASCAGDGWLQKATAAALKLSGDSEKSQGIGNELLFDIRDIFLTKSTNFLATSVLLETLYADDESAWATYNRGKPITARQVSKQLSAYGISSTRLRPGKGADALRGYEREMFDEAFKRYLVDDCCNPPPKTSGTVVQNSANVDTARVAAVPYSKSVPVQSDVIRHGTPSSNNVVPDSTGTKNLSGTAQVSEYNQENIICTAVPDKSWGCAIVTPIKVTKERF